MITSQRASVRQVSRVRRRVGSIAAAALVAGLLAGCAGGGTSSGYGAAPTGNPPVTAPTTPTAAPPTAVTGQPATAVHLAQSSLGMILVDGRGMTLYLYTKDQPNKSNCEGQCLANWPALVGTPTAGDGVDATLLGTITRSDGTVQATYHGWPLYYWVGDHKAGDTTGQNVQQVWYVLNAAGDPIK